MSQPDDPTPDTPSSADPGAQPAAETPTAPPAPPAPPVPPAAAPVLKTRWRDRAFTLRSMVAVGLAGLVLGAGAGVGTALVASHDDSPDFRHQRMGPGGPGGGFPRWEGRDGQDGPPPGWGQMPPGSGPQQQPEAPQDGASGGTSGS
ncbi:hypothetical protein [Nocardioides daeguensis]|nr:hypothetical protein [Nocardioides daeguensis]MBV6729549.1 hypothetical protein [Nocardioides daeguensis]MCR1774981.1 hypothetical protein [Nocardioides daeguensis]